MEAHVTGEGSCPWERGNAIVLSRRGRTPFCRGCPCPTVVAGASWLTICPMLKKFRRAVTMPRRPRRGAPSSRKAGASAPGEPPAVPAAPDPRESRHGPSPTAGGHGDPATRRGAALANLCVLLAEVECRGLRTEGIYRRSGSKTEVDALASALHSGKLPRLGSVDPLVVADAVKRALRAPFPPAVPHDRYADAIEVAFGAVFPLRPAASRSMRR